MDTALPNLLTAVKAVVAVEAGTIPVDRLGAHILGLQRCIDALRVKQAELIRTADHNPEWNSDGHRDMASWLAAKGKTSVGTAKRQQKLGEAIAKSPALADAVRSGDISPDAAEALAATLGSDHSGDEADLIQACAGATPAQAKAAGTIFQEMNKPDGQTDTEREHARRQRRYLRFTDTGDGMTRVDGLLPTYEARIVSNAAKHIAGDPFADDRSPEQRLADGLVMLADAYNKGSITGGRDNANIIITIDLDTFNNGKPGAGYTANGDIIPTEIIRQMVPNATLQRLLLGDSVPLDLGRTRRLASDHQYRALLARDGGCRHPDCNIPATWCQVDHILEWDADDGPTDLQWLILWCFYHHKYRHSPRVRLEGDANDLDRKSVV